MITESVFFIEYHFLGTGVWHRMQCVGPFYDPLSAADIAGRLASGISDTEYRVVQYRRVDA